MSINSATVMGRLGQEPKANDKNTVVNFSLAVDRWNGKEKVTNWVNCKAIGKTVEVVLNYCHKGDLVCVSGELVNESYERDGERKYISYVLVQRLGLTGKKSGGEGERAETNSEEDLPF